MTDEDRLDRREVIVVLVAAVLLVAAFVVVCYALATALVAYW